MSAEHRAGVDEVGRGTLAGPVIAAAVILNPKEIPAGLNDSKLLSSQRREYLNAILCETALAWAIGRAEVHEIDTLNIFQATLLAMQRAVEGLALKPHSIIVDGTHAPRVMMPAKTVIRGDQLIAEISAASIIAKVCRDAEMVAYAEQYPEYGFDQHKGYGTKQHLLALQTHGPCRIHRQSFAPVRLSAAKVSAYDES